MDDLPFIQFRFCAHLTRSSAVYPATAADTNGVSKKKKTKLPFWMFVTDLHTVHLQVKQSTALVYLLSCVGTPHCQPSMLLTNKSFARIPSNELYTHLILLLTFAYEI